MKKFIAILMLAIGLGVLTIPAIQAAEINPDPSTYSYGSTSEFSPYATLGQGSNTNTGGGGLAPTGQNTWLLYVAAIIAIVTPITYFGVKKLRK